MKTLTHLLLISVVCSQAWAQSPTANDDPSQKRSKEEQLLPRSEYLNPASFVRFVEKGHRTTTRMNSMTQGQSIRSSSIIRIEFIEIPEEYHDDIEITISAYVKTVDDNIIPIDIPGFATASGTKLQELNSGNKGSDSMNRKVTYSTRKYKDLVATEIDLKSISGLKEGDYIHFTVANIAENSVEHPMSFIIDDFGWKGNATSGPVWVKTYNSERVNFTTSPFAGYSFHYQHRKHSHFLSTFFTPSFGPSAVMVGDATSSFGLGFQMSWLARTVTIGSGYFLNESGNRQHREYYYFGLNFLEGIDAFKEILDSNKSD